MIWLGLFLVDDAAFHTLVAGSVTLVPLQLARDSCTAGVDVVKGAVESTIEAVPPGVTIGGPTVPVPAAYAVVGAASTAAPTTPATSPERIRLLRDLDRDMRAPPTALRDRVGGQDVPTRRVTSGAMSERA